MTALLRAPSAAVTVNLAGDLDIATAHAARRQLMAAVAPGAHLTVDMAGVTFLGASGIGVLVAAANEARATGGDLTLQAPALPVMRVLAALGLGAVLPVVGLRGAGGLCGLAGLPVRVLAELVPVRHLHSPPLAAGQPAVAAPVVDDLTGVWSAGHRPPPLCVVLCARMVALSDRFA